MSVRIAVLASGGGTNLQALIDHFRESLVAEIGLVISDRADAGSLDRARQAGIAAHHVPVQGRPVAAVTADTVDALDSAGIDLIALAGYLRLIHSDILRRFSHRILNIHPALLPAFGGKGMYGRRVHEAVLESGARVTGATVHLVNERYDEGRILAQWPVPVLESDTPDALAARVLKVEHALYPAAVEWLAGVVAAVEGDDAAAAIRSAPIVETSEALCFSLEENVEPDRRGIRRLFGLD